MSDKRKVLIVDDEPQSLHVLLEMLKKEYSVVVAKNSEKALLMAAKEPRPDFILLDIVMPGMDGFEVLKLLKEQGDTKDIPVIFLTGNDDDQSIEKARNSAAAGYLTKPVEHDTLTALIKEVTP